MKGGFTSFLLLCFVFTSIDSGAKKKLKVPGLGVECNVISGKIIKHSPKFTAPIPALSNAFDVNVVWKTYGCKDWQQRRHYPVIGIGATYTGYGNNAVFGRAIGIYPNIQFSLKKWGNLEWTLRIGDGVAYVSKKYQTTAPIDTVNNAISSHINDFAIFMTDLRYHYKDHWDVQAGLSFTHISNADFHDPNLGVNMVGVHLGVRYFPVTCHPDPIKKQLPDLPCRVLVEARAGIGYNEARAKGSPELPNYVGNLYVSKRWRSKNKAMLGTDYAYHESTYAFLRNYGVDYGHEKAHSWQGGIFAGNEYLMGRLGIMLELGVYYRQTFLKQDPYYEKLGGNFYLIQHEHGLVKNMFVYAHLKTHKIVAEFAEFGLGMGI